VAKQQRQALVHGSLFKFSGSEPRYKEEKKKGQTAIESLALQAVARRRSHSMAW
jgi:hypothetical protein